jgi:hypothetical protein
VTALGAAGSALVYSTFLGGARVDEGLGIAVSQGSAFVTGDTRSVNYPSTPGAPDRILSGPTDAFVTALAPGSVPAPRAPTDQLVNLAV